MRFPVKSGKIYDFNLLMSDVLYAVYCCILWCFWLWTSAHDRISYLDQKFLSESRCFFVNEYGRLSLFCDDKLFRFPLKSCKIYHILRYYAICCLLFQLDLFGPELWQLTDLALLWFRLSSAFFSVNEFVKLLIFLWWLIFAVSSEIW